MRWKSMPANNLVELIAWMRANPGRVTLGHTGLGSPAHVAFIAFQKLTGARLQDVAYRSAGQAMQDVIAGHIDMMMASPSIGLAAVHAGNVKAYAVTAASRLIAAPDIPTVDEAGLPGFYAAGWFGLWAPKGTPQDIISRLNAALPAALADPTVRARLDDLGQEIFPLEQQTPEALAALQKAEIEKWWPLIKEAGIKLKAE
jgi:tripartite-type tricarboxylate transporter receptor subunit TctC